MRRNFWTQPLLPNSVRPLVHLEWRNFRRNWMACAVLLMILFVAGMVRVKADTQQSLGGPVCYVVYWEKNDWVSRLETAARAARDERGLQIEVVPVEKLSDSDGIIRYPPGSHSIQLRPLDASSAGERGGWLIWYWYSGSDAATILPYVQWFQRVTHAHFNQGIAWHEQTSPLRPEFVVFGKNTRVAVDSVANPDRTSIALIWMALFFVACHLSKLSLVESLCARTLHSLVVTPAGWQAPGIANRLFYGLLALLLAGCSAAILKPELLTSAPFWLTALCGICIYLGVSFTIAAWCSSVSSAAVATGVYLGVSGLLYAAAASLPGTLGTILPTCISAEAALFSALNQLATPGESTIGISTIAAMLLWAIAWQITGELSYRRLRRA